MRRGRLSRLPREAFRRESEETAATLNAAELSSAFRHGRPQLPVHTRNARTRALAERLPRRRARHLESTWSYDLGDASYVGPMLGSGDHWVRRLPGKLFHNHISHGSQAGEFLGTTSPKSPWPPTRAPRGHSMARRMKLMRCARCSAIARHDGVVHFFDPDQTGR